MSSLYKPRRVRKWRLLSSFVRLLASLLKVWPLLLIGAFIISPISPHLRWTYQYRDSGQTRIYINCNYLGMDGVVFPKGFTECPIILFIDRRTGRPSF